MRRVRRTIVAGLWIISSIGRGAESERDTTVNLEAAFSKASYAFGVDMGTTLGGMSEEFYFEIDMRAFIRGVQDAVEKRKTLLTSEEARLAKSSVLTKGKTLRFELGEKSKKAGEEYLAANKTKEGVISTASGLQYIVLKPGDGPKSGDGDTMVVHYRGTLLDGTAFVNTHTRAEPEKIVANRALPGLAEALRLMQVGAEWRLFVPPQLAYGARGRGRAILPYATLIYEIELLGIEPAKEPAEKEPGSKRMPEPVALPAGEKKTDIEGKAGPERKPER